MDFKKWKPKNNLQVFNTYGKIAKINLFMVLVLFCLITPATNWMIPFCKKFEKIEVFRVTLRR